MLHTEEQGDKTTVAFIGREFPFIQELVKDRLQKRGCEVVNITSPHVFPDYIIFFGNVQHQETLLKKLKDGGKAIIVANYEHEVKKKRVTLATYIISVRKGSDADTLAKSILRKLFSSLSITNPRYVRELGNSAKRQKKEIKPKETKPLNKTTAIFRYWSSMISGTIIFVLLATIPFDLVIASIGIAGYSLNEASKPGRSIQQREIAMRRAVQFTSFGKNTYQILTPLVQRIAPVADTQINETISILNGVTDTALSGVGLERIITKEGKQLFAQEPSVVQDKMREIKDMLSSMDLSMQSAELSYKKLSIYRNQFPLRLVWSRFEAVPTIQKSIAATKEALTILPQFLAFKEQKTYLLLLQNNFELRPTGGFIGSYGLLTVADGKIKTITIQDVYEADGQLKGAVEPPQPISAYLNQPNWFLRDANWNPDFMYSAIQAEWFLKKELNTDVDGVIAIDLHVIKNILAATGPVYVPDFAASVSSDDFFYKLEADTHEGFFPGSTKKKDLLTSLTSALLLALTEQKNLSYLPILQALETSVEQKHILLYFHDPLMQNTVERLGWAGRILNPQALTAGGDNVSDYLMLVEANLGVNKTNYYLTRELFASLSVKQKTIQEEFTIRYQNNSPISQNLFGGTYKNYLRILLPKDAMVESVSVNDQALNIPSIQLSTGSLDKNTLGFLATVEPQQTTKIILMYELPYTASKQLHYQLLLQKQPGTDADPLVVKLKNMDGWRITNTNIASFPYLSNLTTDRLFVIDFKRVVE